MNAALNNSNANDFPVERVKIETTMTRSDQYSLKLNINGKRKTVKIKSFDQASIFAALMSAYGSLVYHPAIEVFYENPGRDETTISVWDATLENQIGRGTLTPIL